MKKFLRSDILYGLVLTVLFAVSYLGSGFVLETLELKFYDLRARLRQNPSPAKEIAIIAIDDDSLAKLGRWPWPRSRIAQILNTLSRSKPKVIGLNILFSEPEKNQGLQEIERVRQEYLSYLEEAIASQRKAAKNRDWAAKRTERLLKGLEKDPQLLAIFEEAESRLNNDSKLAQAIQASGNVVLPMFFNLEEDMNGQPPPLPDSIAHSSLISVRSTAEPAYYPHESSQATIPLEIFASSAAGVGYVNLSPDIDGTVRRDLGGIAYKSRFYPSFALQIVRNYLGIKPEDVKIVPGVKITLGKLEIPLNPDNSYLTTFNGPAHTFPYFPFYDVINDKVAPEAFKDKIVLIGPTAVGVGTLYVTPVAHNFPGVEIVANTVENLLHRKFLSRPDGAVPVEIGLILLIGLFVTFLLPRLKALPGAILSMIILTGLLGAGTYLFVNNSVWLKTSYPALLLIAGYTLITTKRFLTTEKRKELVELSAIETNKMLGLSFQGQGMLDLAFEKFRACPLDEALRDLLYNLALDFERKRQFNKAASVYEHIASKYPRYKDIEKKPNHE